MCLVSVKYSRMFLASAKNPEREISVFLLIYFLVSSLYSWHLGLCLKLAVRKQAQHCMKAGFTVAFPQCFALFPEHSQWVITSPCLGSALCLALCEAVSYSVVCTQSRAESLAWVTNSYQIVSPQADISVKTPM